jgi:hypothetical protein
VAATPADRPLHDFGIDCDAASLLKERLGDLLHLGQLHEARAGILEPLRFLVLFGLFFRQRRGCHHRQGEREAQRRHDSHMLPHGCVLRSGHPHPSFILPDPGVLGARALSVRASSPGSPRRSEAPARTA